MDLEVVEVAAANKLASTPSNPISSLNPYVRRWRIKGRVTNKGDMRTWQNAKGSGSLFSFDLLDAEGGEICATCFKDMATKLFGVIEVGQVYVVSNGQVKLANKKFSTLKGDYELTLNNETHVTVVQDDTSIKLMHYNFTKLAELEALPEDRVVDVIGVLREAAPLEEFSPPYAENSLARLELLTQSESNKHSSKQAACRLRTRSRRRLLSRARGPSLSGRGRPAALAWSSTTNATNWLSTSASSRTAGTRSPASSSWRCT